MGWFSRKQPPAASSTSSPASPKPAASDHECCKSDPSCQGDAATAGQDTASPKKTGEHECCGGKHRH